MADPKFERDFDPDYGRLVQVSPLVQRLVCNNPSPFTYTGTATFIIGGDHAAVIDPGPDDPEHLKVLMAALDGRTLDHIFITHTHRDHSPLAAKLKQLTGAKTIAFGAHGEGGRNLSGAAKSGDTALDASGDMDFTPDIRVAHGDVIEGMGWSLEAVFTPGHTSNHMSFALAQENTLFCGDHVMAWSTSVISPPDGNMADYFASLDVVLKRGEDTYLPTHGPERRDPKPFVSALIKHRRMREEAILRRFAAGDRTIPQVVETVYAAIDKRLHKAAAMSTLAHVEHLIERGKLKTDDKVGIEAEYYV